MKVALLCLLLASPLALGKKSKSSYEDERLCPDGYTFAGDDTNPEDINTNEPRDVYYEEVARSPEYSCYKLINAEVDFLTAMQTCIAEEATLASFEDLLELSRVAEKFQPYLPTQSRPDYEVHDYEFLTSGMYFDDVRQWYWTGTNKSNKIEFNIDGESQGDNSINSTPLDCLNVKMPYRDPNEPRDEDFLDQVKLQATKCFGKNNYMCEARVETVTYYAWFYTNWVDFLLGFLIVILFVALCISVCAYSSNDYGRRSARRRQNMTHANRNTMTATVVDLPPNYETAVRIHKPDDSKPTTSNSQASAGRMTYYKNRGKELMGKIYVYKPSSNNNNAH